MPNSHAKFFDDLIKESYRKYLWKLQNETNVFLFLLIMAK